MPSISGKKVLVTGGAGFIGSNIAIRLLNEGAQVTVVDSMIEGLGGNEFNLSPVLKEVRFLKTDLRDSSAMVPLVKDAEYVFNMAGNVSHSDSMKNPIEDNALNTVAQIHMLDLFRKHNSSAVILYAGTRQIYGTPQYLPVDEKHPINPIDVNGINKLAAEYYHYLFGKIYGMKTVTLRLTNTYGPRQLIRHARQGFIGWFMNRAVLGEPIQLFGGGAQVRDFTYVDDVAEAFLRASLNPTCYGEVYILSGERASLEEVGNSLVKIAGGKSKIDKVPFPADKKAIDIGDYYGSSEKFYKATGWQARKNLREGLSDMYEYFSQHKDKYL